MPGEMRTQKFDPNTIWPGWARLKGFPAAERKKLLILAFLLCLGTGLMLWAGKAAVSNHPPLLSEQKASAPGRAKEGELWEKQQLEMELSSTLSRIKGAGRVKVEIVTAKTAREHWLYRETTEERVNRQEDGSLSREQRTQREPVFRRGSGGVEEPVRIVREAPVVAGVLVVAEGAEDPVTCRRLWEATATVLGIPLHRVMVLPWGE